MATITQSSLSRQFVPVLITAQGAVPTDDAVQMAFVAGGNPGPDDWNAATWADQPNLPSNQGIAICLVGPGGTIALAVGTYQIWVRVTDNPEVPVQPAGTLAIF